MLPNHVNSPFCWGLNLYFPKLLPGSVVVAGNVESCCWNTAGFWLPDNAVPWSVTSTDLMTRYDLGFSHSSQIWHRKCHCAAVGSSCPKSLNYGKETVSSSKTLCISEPSFREFVWSLPLPDEECSHMFCHLCCHDEDTANRKAGALARYMEQERWESHSSILNHLNYLPCRPILKIFMDKNSLFSATPPIGKWEHSSSS